MTFDKDHRVQIFICMLQQRCLDKENLGSKIHPNFRHLHYEHNLHHKHDAEAFCNNVSK